MILLVILIISEFLTFLVFRQHYKGYSKTKYYLSSVINAIVSIFMWILYTEVSSFKGNFDEPGHIWLMMSLTGTFCAVLVPRVLLDLLHFTGKILKLRKGGHIRWLTNTGIFIWLFFFIIIVSGTLYGKFNFKTDEVTIKVEGLNKDLEGLTIVQLSDLHLSSFYRHKSELRKVMRKVNSYKPDILINTGDFVSYGWREFDNSDTILSLAKGRFGNFAVLGNHDIGTYHPNFKAAEMDTNISRMIKLIELSGYKVLNDENIIIKVGEARVGIAGIITRGRHPHMIHGNLGKAISGMDSVDLKILLSHDPNQWAEDVTGKTDIDLTFSGHTHGMQMGILTRGIKWSPSQYFYPRWNGLYTEGKQFLYVNRGLGVLAIPFRIWMPPEISVIKLTGK
jgi:predicted MPP superfamily phosphohydrolase